MKTILAPEIRKANWPEKQFIIKKAKVAFDKLPSFFAESYAAMYQKIQELGLETNEPPCAIYYSVDETNMQTELAAAVPVKGVLPDTAEFDKVVIPNGKAITTTYTGPYDNIAPVYGELEAYLKDHHLKRKLIIEEYVTDPQTEKDPEKWITNVYFILDE